jgi:hypothetical protein
MSTEEGQKDTDKLSEKRAALRSRSIVKEPIKSYPKQIFVGITITILFVLILIGNSFQNVNPSPGFSQGNNTSKTNVSVSNEVDVASFDSGLTGLNSDLSVPTMKIISPKNNSVVDSTTPQLEFLVAGNNLDDVILSVDDNDTTKVPHDGKFAEINFAKLGLIFIEDFSGGAERWNPISGDWDIIDGAYFQRNYNKGINGEAYYPLNSNEYIVEYRTKIVNVGNTLQSKFNFLGKTGSSYCVVLFAKEKKVGLLRTDNWAAIKIIDYPIQPDIWYKIKLIVNNTQIDVFVNNELVIDAKVNLFSGEGISLSSWESQVYFDDIQAYTPLINGPHKLILSAKNKGNAYSVNTVYFTVNATSPAVAENIRYTVGSTITKGGISVRLERVNILDYTSSIWIYVENNNDFIIPLRLSPAPVIIDNFGTQYENIKIERSAEIAQTELQPNSNRAGAVFFERLKEGAKPKKLILNMNGKSFEYFLD